MMDRHVLWRPIQWPGLEHLHVRHDGGRVVADGMVIAVLDQGPVRLGYQVVCDDAWRVQQLTLAAYGLPPTTLVRDGQDRWRRDGIEVPELAGCHEVDISLTPFTNTLPIRRLQLEPGQSADLRVVYVLLEPTLEITAQAQTYTRLAAGGDADYRYQAGDFTADLPVDDGGLVTDYPELWTRV